MSDSGPKKGATGGRKEREVEDWIKPAPKVELHVHLDGAFDTSLLWEHVHTMAPEDIPVEKTAWSGEKLHLREILTRSLGSFAEFDAAISTEGKIGGLGKVLDCFELFFPLVKGNKRLLEQLTVAFCQAQMDQNIIYTEVRYAPHFLAASADEMPKTTLPTAESVAVTITDVLTTWCKTHPGFTVNQILCCVDSMPNISPEVSALAVKFKGDSGGVVGVDVACGEFSFTVADEKHRNAFATHKEALLSAKQAGLGITVHAGESGGGQNVLCALEQYGADRIGHGYKAFTDDAVLARCRDATRRPHFEVCPTSSIACESVPDPDHAPRSSELTWDARLGEGGAGWEKHVLSKMVADTELSISISSDDPSVFGCTLSSELSLMARRAGMDRARMRQLTENGVNAAFIPHHKKQELLAVIEEYHRMSERPEERRQGRRREESEERIEELQRAV